ncbi:phage minor head protein [Sphingobacterium spiritivorum]|uniref:phage minor head protein n=1 Tax=Sphingobacterium spiritivorum TaxID=258 RepID=UPI003DA5F321
MNNRQKLKRFILQQERKLIAYEKRYAKLIRIALLEQVEYAIENRGVIPDLPMFNALKSLYETVTFDFLQLQYNSLEREVKKDAGFFLNMWRTWIQSYVFTALAMRVSNINETTRKRIQEAIAIGVDQGLEWDVIAKLIREKVGDISSLKRAIMIARTETANSANMAKEKSSEDWERETGEVLYKLWIHRYAKEPRSWHQRLDNEVAIPKSQKFTVYNPRTGSTEYMLRPHSDGATAENVVNCSCQVIYVSESFAKNLAKDLLN